MRLGKVRVDNINHKSFLEYWMTFLTVLRMLIMSPILGLRNTLAFLQRSFTHTFCTFNSKQRASSPTAYLPTVATLTASWARQSAAHLAVMVPLVLRRPRVAGSKRVPLMRRAQTMEDSSRQCAQEAAHSHRKEKCWVAPRQASLLMFGLSISSSSPATWPSCMKCPLCFPPNGYFVQKSASAYPLSAWACSWLGKWSGCVYSQTLQCLNLSLAGSGLHSSRARVSLDSSLIVAATSEGSMLAVRSYLESSLTHCVKMADSFSASITSRLAPRIDCSTCPSSQFCGYWQFVVAGGCALKRTSSQASEWWVSVAGSSLRARSQSTGERRRVAGSSQRPPYSWRMRSFAMPSSSWKERNLRWFLSMALYYSCWCRQRKRLAGVITSSTHRDSSSTPRIRPTHSSCTKFPSALSWYVHTILGSDSGRAGLPAPTAAAHSSTPTAKSINIMVAGPISSLPNQQPAKIGRAQEDRWYSAGGIREIKQQLNNYQILHLHSDVLPPSEVPEGDRVHRVHLRHRHLDRPARAHHLRPGREEGDHQRGQPGRSHRLPHRPLPLLHPLPPPRRRRPLGLHEGHVQEVEQGHLPARALLHRRHGLLPRLPRRHHLLLRGPRDHLRHRLHLRLQDHPRQRTLRHQQRSLPEVLLRRLPLQHPPGLLPLPTGQQHRRHQHQVRARRRKKQVRRLPQHRQLQHRRGDPGGPGEPAGVRRVVSSRPRPRGVRQLHLPLPQHQRLQHPRVHQWPRELPRQVRGVHDRLRTHRGVRLPRRSPHLLPQHRRRLLHLLPPQQGQEGLQLLLPHDRNRMIHQHTAHQHTTP